MKLRVRLTAAFFLSLAFVVLAGLTMILVGENKVVAFDASVANFVQSFETGWLTSLSVFLAFFGGPTMNVVLAVLALVVLAVVLKHRAELVLFLWVVGGSAILNTVMKHLFERARPNVHRLAEETGYSFPSGHSMAVVALYGVLTFLLWRHVRSSAGRGLLVAGSAVMILGIGVSRIYLGVHYPSDVLGGLLTGGFWLSASIYVYQGWRERKAAKK